MESWAGCCEGCGGDTIRDMRDKLGNRLRLRRGYTLTDLIVTIVVISIISLISIGGFLAVAGGSKHETGFATLEAAQSALRSAAVATGGVYSSGLISSLAVNGVTISSGAVTTSGAVSVAVDPSDSTQAIMVATGKPGECLVLIDNPLAATRYGEFTAAGAFTCNAAGLSAPEIAEAISTDIMSPSVMVA